VSRTIGEDRAVGVCGSGLIDAVACLLENGLVDETGATDEEELPLRDGIVLMPRDIREVQLAKAAIAAGIECLLHTAGIKHEQVQRVYLAGGFGSHLNLTNAARIGLLPESLISRTKVIGNAALDGTVMTLLRGENLQALRRIASCAKHVDLGGNPVFNEQYVEMMFFPEE
jgi:uncharacterized 2Fe-2S/4Fe-4S cluster protein (DUF4445 family)